MTDTTDTTPLLTTRDALIAYATMMNTGDATVVASLLAPEFRYTSQNVLSDLVGKEAYLDFMTAKFETMRKADVMPVADLVKLPGWGHVLGVVLWQGQPPERQCVVYADVADGVINAFHLCVIPSPEAALPYALWPGLSPDRPRPMTAQES